jgi:hypothetical protein
MVNSRDCQASRKWRNSDGSHDATNPEFGKHLRREHGNHPYGVPGA